MNIIKLLNKVKVGVILPSLFAIMIPSGMLAQQRWTLQECIDYAIENNISLKKTVLSKQSSY